MAYSLVHEKIGDLFFTTSGGTPSRRNPDFYGGHIPWVKSGELKQNIIFDTEEYITDQAVQSSSTKVFPTGTLLIALYGATIGKLAFLGVNAATNQAVCGIYENGIINHKYVYYYFLFKRPKLVQLGTGGAQPNISQDIIKKQKFPVIPLPEQRAIVAKIEQLFSELDNGIANFKTALEQLKVYRQAVLKKAFEGELTKAWRAKQTDLPTAEELLEQIRVEREKAAKDQGKKIKELPKLTQEELSSLSKLPDGWNWIKLDQIGELYCGQSPSVTEVNTAGRGMLYVTGPEQWNGREIEKTKWTEFPKRIVPNGSIFITVKGAGVGKLFPGINCAIGRDVYAYLPSEHLNYSYVLHALKWGIDVVIMKAQGDIPGLSKNHILEHYIGLCSSREQHQIVQEIESRLSVCDKVEETIKDSLEKAEALRQSILKKAFEGKLLTEQELEACRQQPHWEPAEKLLERIKKEGGKAARKSKKAQTAEVL